MPKPRTDVKVQDHGSVVLLTPVSRAARDWFTENVQQDGMRWAGAYACDRRPAQAIVDGLLADGLTIE